MATALLQLAAGAPLIAQDLPDNQTELVTQLTVLACAPGVSDLSDPARQWPRVPGAAFAGVDEEGRRWLCGGLVPCGQCQRCQTAHHEACLRPHIPGISGAAPGGLATNVALPRAHRLAPLEGPDLRPEAIPEAAALVAAAGLTYQATASAGMVPGDTVYVIGDVGPGALPLRLLQALGLCPVWIGGDAAADAPEGVPRCPTVDELPEPSSPRCHTVALSPVHGAPDSLPPLARQSLTLTFAGPATPDGAAPLGELLSGAATVRWVRHLHPHLVLDLAALALTGDLELTPRVEACDMATFPAAWEALNSGRAERWPVLVQRQTF